jgi:hypothetical protein
MPQTYLISLTNLPLKWGPIFGTAAHFPGYSYLDGPYRGERGTVTKTTSAEHEPMSDRTNTVWREKNKNSYPGGFCYR